MLTLSRGTERHRPSKVKSAAAPLRSAVRSRCAAPQSWTTSPLRSSRRGLVAEQTFGLVVLQVAALTPCGDQFVEQVAARQRAFRSWEHVFPYAFCFSCRRCTRSRSSDVPRRWRRFARRRAGAGTRCSSVGRGAGSEADGVDESGGSAISGPLPELQRRFTMRVLVPSIERTSPCESSRFSLCTSPAGTLRAARRTPAEICRSGRASVVGCRAARTFGRGFPSRRTFGRGFPSRRTFGRGFPSRRTFGRGFPRRTFGARVS